MFDSTFVIARQFIGVVRIWLKLEFTMLIGQYVGILIVKVVPAGNSFVGVILNIIIVSTFI